MAVTAAGLVAALRLGSSTEELAEATRLLGTATALVENRTPAAPDVIKDEAVVRVAAFLYDQPNYTPGRGDASILRNSGAGELLLAYHVTRAVSTGESVASAATGNGVTEARVMELIEAHRAVTDAHHTPPTLPMPATPAEAGNGTSTTLRGWTSALIRRAINAVVPTWARTGNTDQVPANKLPPAGVGAFNPSTAGSYEQATDDPSRTMRDTGVALSALGDWFWVSYRFPHTAVGGPYQLVRKIELTSVVARSDGEVGSSSHYLRMAELSSDVPCYLGRTSGGNVTAAIGLDSQSWEVTLVQ